MNGIGETLRKTRIEKQITFSDVERETRIRKRYLEALEAEEWDILPGAVYTRGFFTAVLPLPGA